jgi:arylsulfatase A-like enzyme
MTSSASSTPARSTRILFLLLALALTAPATASTPGQADRPAPDLLLITVDTLRADALGAYGNPLVYTATLDRLARNSRLFSAAQSHVPITNPSHASMLTGRYPPEHGATNFGIRIHPEIPTLATLLRAAGYRCAAFVSGFSLAAEVSGLERGFEIYDDDWPEGAAERPADVTVRRAVHWLREIPRDQPIFLWIHLFDPHKPYLPPRIFGRLREPGYRGPTTAPAHGQLVLAQNQAPAEPEPAAGVIDPRELERNRNRYLGEVDFVDRQLTRLLRRLARFQRLDNTCLVLTSDHGESFSHGYYFRHIDRLYQSLLHVPLIIATPGVTPGIDRQLCAMIDLLPTLAAILPIDAPPGLPGTNLLPRKSTPGHQPRPFELAHVPGRSSKLSLGPLLSANDRDRKLIRLLARQTFEAYNLARDPGETRSLDSPWSDLDSAIQEYRKLFTSTPAEEPELDEEALETFRRLGYVR